VSDGFFVGVDAETVAHDDCRTNELPQNMPGPGATESSQKRTYLGATEAPQRTTCLDVTESSQKRTCLGATEASQRMTCLDATESHQRKPRLERGLLQVYTGDGKGKTTAALGQCVRAAGYGLRALILQFIKAGAATSELTSAQLLGNLEIRQLGRALSFIKGKPSPDDVEHARRGWAEAQKAISSGEYDVVVLDEMNVVLDLGMLSSSEVVPFLQQRPAHVEVILTGRNAPNEVIDAADLVTEMRCVKHPYEKGIAARKGIEY
jgi:cob(I)alamin adenosyltransferase